MCGMCTNVNTQDTRAWMLLTTGNLYTTPQRFPTRNTEASEHSDTTARTTRKH